MSSDVIVANCLVAVSPSAIIGCRCPSSCCFTPVCVLLTTRTQISFAHYIGHSLSWGCVCLCEYLRKGVGFGDVSWVWIWTSVKSCMVNIETKLKVVSLHWCVLYVQCITLNYRLIQIHYKRGPCKLGWATIVIYCAGTRLMLNA